MDMAEVCRHGYLSAVPAPDGIRRLRAVLGSLVALVG